MSPRRNWDSPNPSPISECAFPTGLKGGGVVHTRRLQRGWGSLNSDDWRKGLAVALLSTLPTLWEKALVKVSLHTKKRTEYRLDRLEMQWFICYPGRHCERMLSKDQYIIWRRYPGDRTMLHLHHTGPLMDEQPSGGPPTDNPLL